MCGGRGIRIGASRMFDLSRVLDVAVAFFVDCRPQDVAMQSPRRRIGIAASPAEPFEPDPMAKRETLELVRAYYRIKDPNVRKPVFELSKALAHASNPE